MADQQEPHSAMDAWAEGLALPGVSWSEFRDAFKAANPARPGGGGSTASGSSLCPVCEHFGVIAAHPPHGEACRMVQAVAAKNGGVKLPAPPPPADVSMTRAEYKAADPREAVSAALPPDPFSRDFEAGVALNDMLNTMTEAGMPLASAERVLGTMLAVHGIMQKEADGGAQDER